MYSLRNLMTSLLLGLPLLACSHPSTPDAGQAATSSTANGLIATQVDKALDQARQELRSGNLSLNGDIHVSVNGHRVRSPDAGLPKAEITPQGDLLIGGKPVTVTPEQRRLLLDYRQHVLALAEAGMNIGVKGAAIADEALRGVAGAIFGGEKSAQAFEQRMDAKGKAIEAEARTLCTQLPPLLTLQQQLAATLPAFKPYATMTQADIDDCATPGHGHGVAVTQD
jgi:hypothetical protein